MKARDASKALLVEVDELDGAAALLRREQMTYMPSGGLSAQLHAAAVAAHPEISGHIANGEVGTLPSGLRDDVYPHGAKLTASEPTLRATGERDVDRAVPRVSVGHVPAALRSRGSRPCRPLDVAARPDVAPSPCSALPSRYGADGAT